MSEFKITIKSAWRSAHPVIVAALAAHGVAAWLTAVVSPAPLWTAIATTLTFAVVWWAIARRVADNGDPVPRSTQSALYAAAMTAAGVLVGAGLIAAMLGTAHTFYCAPTIPWRIEIALFGSVFVGLVARIVQVRGLSQWLPPLALIALLWIAPYYGYFSAAVFLGLSLMVDCRDLPVVQLYVAALGMVAGKALGCVLADWLTRPPRGAA